MEILRSRLQQLLDVPNIPEPSVTRSDILIIERSIESSKHVFLRSLSESGTIQASDASAYNAWYDTVLKALQKRVFSDVEHGDNSANSSTESPLLGVFYLDVSPETCLERSRTRMRDSESNLDMTFVRQLDEVYKDWLSSPPFSVASSSSSSSSPYSSSSFCPASIPVHIMKVSGTEFETDKEAFKKQGVAEMLSFLSTSCLECRRA